MADQGGVVLFEKDSAYDLFLRGFGVKYACRNGHVKFRPAADVFWNAAKAVDCTAYWAEHVRQRCLRIDVLDMLAAYGRNDMKRADLITALGFFHRIPDYVVSLSQVLRDAGYGPEFDAAVFAHERSVQDRIAATNQVRYGGKSPMASDAVRRKMRDSMFARFGVENVSQAAEVKAKKAATCREHFGVDYSLQAESVRRKAKATIRERYGVDNVSQADEIKAKKAATCMAHFGVPYSLLDPGVRAKQIATLRARYGSDGMDIKGPFSIPSILEKARETYYGKCGFENPLMNPDVRDAIRQGWIDRFGVDNPSRVPAIQAKRVQTISDRYGVDNPFQYEEFKAKARATTAVRYGFEYVSQAEEIKRRVCETKVLHGTECTSSSEENLYLLLVERFGKSDVVRQYRKDPRYPFACDFYVKSRDMFIELNGTWTHGGHWYDPANGTDRQVLSVWSNKVHGGNEYYKSAVHTWTVADVRKRETARGANLNYVVFWLHTIEDAALWAAMGCPDGRDWDRMYSWMPDRTLRASFRFPERLSTAEACIQAAKAANGCEFYKNELAYWTENDPCDVNAGTPRAALYINRYKYLGKLPCELTDAEILRGLSLGFFVTGYSSFDVTGMDTVFSRYGVRSVYDPCAGWGERLVYCGSHGIRYFGCDVNPAVVDGHAKIVEHYGFDGAVTVCADSGDFDASGFSHDAVFTCPPYGDREIYTECGAENLPWAEFLGWWRRVVEHGVSSMTRVFAYQVDQKHKEEMNAVLRDAGWQLSETLPVGVERVSHGVRCRGLVLRKNFEEIQVFVRRDAAET